MAAPTLASTWAAADSPQGLANSIVRLHHEFVDMKRELKQAHGEITRLKQELARQQSRHQPPWMLRGLDVDIAALRRRVSFYCHPDRGGDNRVMSLLNMVFDYLEQGTPGGRP